MKKYLNNKILILSLSLLLPLQAYAYESLAKIPGLSANGNLSDYINALFNVAMMIGVILSVLIIAYSGFEYMTMDVATNKTNAKTRIGHAIAGLLMLLGTYLILHQINPNIVKIGF